MTRLPIYKRGEIIAHALVDDEDGLCFGGVRWGMSTDGYAHRSEYAKGKKYNTFLHRLIVGLPLGDPRLTDHINRDKLDCRRANLRIVTKPQNGQNRPKVNHLGISRFRGVDRHNGKWRARITIDGTQHHVGHFNSEREAAAAVSTYRRQAMPFSEADAA